MKNIKSLGTAIFKVIPLLSERKIESISNKKSKVFGQIKSRFSLWLKIDFRKMASNEHVELR